MGLALCQCFVVSSLYGATVASRALAVFLLLVLAEHSRGQKHGLLVVPYMQEGSLEEGPFVEIQIYCASFCSVKMWHGNTFTYRGVSYEMV